jgi:uncharacterized protein (TIGR02145 family)
MKKSTIFACLMLALLNIQAQNYLISFTGTGDTNVVSNVKVDNLTSGETITLSGDDVLHLVRMEGISTLDNDNSPMKIYPNPMLGQSILSFEVPENGNAVLSVVDLSGKTICQINSWLSHGANSFRISGINQGMYFLKVSGKNYNYSTKLISQNNLRNGAIIESIPCAKNNRGNHLKSTGATVIMPYTDGDQLLFKGSSGIYSTIVPDIPVSNRTITFNFHDCTDVDNNNYTIVQIGDQTWMAENLNVGVRVYGNQEQVDNEIIEKYCYNDDDSLCIIYGGLYQWNEAMQYTTTEGVQGICPSNWHLPMDAEWTTLADYLGGEYIAGGKLKETGTTHWSIPNTSATNEVGFTALPGGHHESNGLFYEIGHYGIWWSSTEAFINDVWDLYMSYDNRYAYRGNDYKVHSFSVRCIKD